MAIMPSKNDGVLVISLLYLSIDMQFQWQEFVHCHWPVNRWLLVSYFLIIAFRLSHIFGSMHAADESGDFLLNLRHKDTLPQVLMSLTWLLVLPFFAIWTAVGTYWLWESKRLSAQCLPEGVPLYFIIIWQVLSYAWLIIHLTLGGVAWVLENRVRKAEENLRAIEDPDTIARWGSVSQLSGYTALSNNSLGGLTPDQIKELPEAPAGMLWLDEDAECSICLNGFCDHDVVRQLGSCGHTFHRSCIDLWLLRRADCPLCKKSVLVNESDFCGQCSEQWHV
jgi:hypothetical protein